MSERALNITNGDYFNSHFLANNGGEAVPFCEVMMDGETVERIYSDEFIRLRANRLNVTEEMYISKMHVCKALADNEYSELRLWFGEDTFCQMNLLTLLAYLEQISFSGKVVLNIIDDSSFATVKENIPVQLGVYSKLYNEILVQRKEATEVGVISPRAVELFFDYHSAYGKLAEIVKSNAHLDETALVSLLMSESDEYGLSDLQAKKLIEKYGAQV